MNKKLFTRLNRLLGNSRFWILAVGINLSLLIAGFMQLYMPSGTLLIIREEQAFGFISMLLLYLAILASPLTKVFPKLFFKEQYLHARRAIGVLAFYYACLHTYLTFFKQLNGFSGFKYLNTSYKESVIFGLITLLILLIMTITSIDWAVDLLHYKNWKLLHRLVYIASEALLLHILILGPHYSNLNIISIVTGAAVIFLIVLECIRMSRYLEGRAKNSIGRKSIK
jgi:sulfoxide reductase heme-binding subunit YedZ